MNCCRAINCTDAALPGELHCTKHLAVLPPALRDGSLGQDQFVHAVLRLWPGAHVVDVRIGAATVAGPTKSGK